MIPARISLATKIAGLTALLLVMLGIVMYTTFSILSKRQTTRTIEREAKTAQRQLEIYLEERATDLKRQAHFAANGVPRIRTLMFLGDKATVTQEMPWLSKQFSVDAFQVVNTDGEVIGESAGLEGLRSISLAEAKKSMAAGTERSRVLRNGSSIFLMACAPVKSGDYPRGAILLFETVGRTQIQRLAQKSGDEFAFTVGEEVVASSINVPFSVPNKIGVPSETEIRGEPYVSILQPFPTSDPKDNLGLVIVRSIRAITEPYEETRGAFFSVLTISLIVSIVGGIALGRGLTRPIFDLAKAARVVQSGEWPQRFEAERNDEIGLLQDAFNDMVSASQNAQNRLLAMIDLDPLTELLNHRSFRERLAQEKRRCDASNDIMSFVLVDMDGFDKLNSVHGRGRGDETLKQVADVLKACLPDYSILSRYAGDQFVALLPNTDAESAAVIMNYVRVRLQQANCIGTVSVGCAEFPKNSTREDGLILAGELALARAKQLGRNRVCVFDAVPGADQATDPFLLYQSLENGSFATIQALAAAVDAKDAYTKGHSERVAKYASQLSTALGDPPDVVDRILRCGTLHDVGKIGVPDTVLQKPGRLDPDEQQVMETHPVLGELIVSKVPQLSELLPGIRHHHERYDGRGYPDGIKGDRIPYDARVLAVADSFDAMTSDRPYRKGLGKEIALGEIRKGAGTQFDPHFAEVFVSVVAPNLGEKLHD